MKKIVKFCIVFFVVLAAVIVWSVYNHNDTYKVNDISGEYICVAYSLPDGERTGAEIISFTGEMEHPENGFDRIDATMTMRGKTFNINKSPLDPSMRFFLTDSDGSYFGTLILCPKKNYNLTKSAYSFKPEIDIFAVLIGGSELRSSYSECKEVIFYTPDKSDEDNGEIISAIIGKGEDDESDSERIFDPNDPSTGFPLDIFS